MLNKGAIYVVATPIGNLEDLSTRAKRVLREVDVILCEDTRVTQKLLSKLELKKTTESLHQHSTDAKLQKVIAAARASQNFALVSDAGTPNISDPGGKLIQLAAAAGVEIVPIPGPSAVTAALSISGFPADTFTFLGFPPHKKGRTKYFQAIEQIDHTAVLFESKHRIQKTLAELPQKRKAIVARELTKLHETIYRGAIQDIIEQLKQTSAKGEFVIVLAPRNW